MISEGGVDQDCQSTFRKLKSPTISKFEEYNPVASLNKHNNLLLFSASLL